MRKNILKIISIITLLIINIKSVNAMIDIKQSSLYLGVNYTQNLKVSGNNGNIEWTSSNNNVVTVNDGKIVGVSTGTAYISAKDNTSIDTCKIIVINNYVPVSSISLSKSSETISVGSTSKIIVNIEPSNASNKTVYYTSSNSSIATVDLDGNIKGIKLGTAYISVNVENKTELYKVTVDNNTNNNDNYSYNNQTVKLNSISIPNTLTVQEGNTGKLNVTYSPSNATNKKITWKSSNTGIVTVDGSGNVKGIKVGTATITATSSDGNHVATSKITVTAVDKTLKGISLNKKELTLEIGNEETLSVNYNPSNAENKKVTWTSSNETIAIVDNGKVKAIKPGTAEIKAISEEGKKEATCKVTVKSAPIESISFGDEEITVYVDSVTTLVTVPTPENTAIINPVWTSSEENVATVKDGTVTAKSIGTTKITVSDESGKISASININVIAKPEEKLLITVDGYDLGFDINTKDYTLLIGNESSLNINVNRNQNKYSIGGNRDLKNGSIITVTINDKTKTTYVINIKKKENYIIYFIGIISVLLFINIIRLVLKNKKKK